jgi:hypothetical protein
MMAADMPATEGKRAAERLARGGKAGRPPIVAIRLWAARFRHTASRRC